MPDNFIGPKILSLDIETSPIVAHAWRMFKTSIGVNQIIENPRTICFAAKFMHERRIQFYSEFEHGPEEMFRRAHALLTEADIVMHYNGDGFDLPRLNGEFLVMGLHPPAPYQSIDLLKVVRKNFGFPSNKLAYITKRLGLEGKQATGGHDLWIRCLAGDPKAWAIMKRYNRQDVRLLEELYELLRPWIKNHPHLGLYSGESDSCPNCGGVDLIRQGYSLTGMGRFQRYQCRGCGTWSRSSRREFGVGNTQSK